MLGPGTYLYLQSRLRFVDVFHIFCLKDTENNSKKESGLKIENKENGAKLLSKSSKVSSLKIFQDASSTVCQHCGVEKSLRSQDAIKCDASIQASENMATQLKDMLCAGKTFHFICMFGRNPISRLLDGSR